MQEGSEGMWNLRNRKQSWGGLNMQLKESDTGITNAKMAHGQVIQSVVIVDSLILKYWNPGRGISPFEFGETKSSHADFVDDAR